MFVVRSHMAASIVPLRLDVTIVVTIIVLARVRMVIIIGHGPDLFGIAMLTMNMIIMIQSLVVTIVGFGLVDVGVPSVLVLVFVPRSELLLFLHHLLWVLPFFLAPELVAGVR